MKQVMRRFIKGATAVPTAVLLCLPPVAIAVWAGAYVFEALDVLQAPGTSVNFSYESPTGTVIVRAGSYAIDTQKQVAVAKDLSLVDPEGQVILFAKNIQLKRLASGGLDLKGSGVTANLIRFADGTFNLDRVLPKADGPAGDSPSFQMMLRNGKINYQDESFGTIDKLTVEVPTGYITGKGGGMRFELDSKIEGVGSVPSQIEILDGTDFEVSLQPKQAKITPLLLIFSKILTKEERQNLAPLSLYDSTATGELDLRKWKDQPLLSYGTLAIKSPRLKYDKTEVSGTIDVNLLGQQLRFLGDLQGSGIKSKLTGIFDWKTNSQLIVDFDGKLRDLNAIKNFAKDIDWRTVSLRGSHFNGQYRMSGSQFQAQGSIEPDGLKISGVSVDKGKLDWYTDNSKAWVRSKSIELNQNNASLALQFDLKSRLVSGGISAKKVTLTKIIRPTKEFQVGGVVDASVEISGKIDNPKWRLQARGDGNFDSDALKRRLNGPILIGVEGTGTQWDLKYLRASSGNASLLAKGSGNADKALNLEFLVEGTQLDLFTTEAQGIASIRGGISGSPQKPIVAANIEVRDFRRGDLEIPFAAAQARLVGDMLTLKQAQAFTGFAEVLGDFKLNLKTKTIEGKIEKGSFELAEWLPGQAAGKMNLTSGTLEGSFDKPLLSGILESSQVQLLGWQPRSIKASVKSDGNIFELVGGQMQFLDNQQIGALSGTAKYDLSKKSGVAELEWAGLPIEPLGQFDPRFSFKGKSDGRAKFDLKNDSAESGQINLTLAEGTELNGGILGAGQIELSGKNGIWSGNGQIGLADRFLLLSDFKSDFKNQSYEGQLDAFNLRAEVLSKLAKPFYETATSDFKRVLNDLTASVNATSTFKISPEGQYLNIPAIEIQNMLINDRSAGKITATGNRSQGSWNFDKIDWQPEENQTLSFSGKITDSGDITGQVASNKLQLDWVNIVQRDFKKVDVLVSGNLDIKGNFENPEVFGSLDFSREPDELDPKRVPPSVSIVAEFAKRQLLLEGQFQAYGFTGKVNGKGSIDAFLIEGSDAPFELNLVQNRPRPIEDFPELLSFLDFEQSDGEISLNISAKARKSPKTAQNRDPNNLQNKISLGGVELDIEGKALFNSTKLKIKGLDSTLDSLSLDISPQDNQIVGKLLGASSSGGTITGAVNLDLRKWLENNDEVDVMRSPLNGWIKADNFTVTQGDRASRNLISMGLTTEGFRVEGTLNQPIIRGTVGLNGIDVDIPVFEPGGEPAKYAINPKFDLQFVTKDPANVRSSGARLKLSGNSYLGGSLEAPEVRSFASILGGTLRLPNARIQIDEGGVLEVKLIQLGGANSALEVPVRMTGRTNLTAKRVTGQYERYDVTLDISGDLLKAGDLTIRGESDPNDLSQDEILAIIGQKELLESLATAAGDTRSSQFRESLFGLAVPTLTDSFTSLLSEQLGLDYISIDYNPFDQTTVSAAKSLNNYLSLRAWRRVPLNNSLKDRYELRLVYRIPTNNSFLSRSRLALVTGTNQRLRISFEYSGRL